MPIEIFILDLFNLIAWPTTTVIVTALVRATILALFLRTTVSTLTIAFIEHTSREDQSDAPRS